MRAQEIQLPSYSFDFMQYDENTRHLDPYRFRSMHRIDYWTGYPVNMGAHKTLISEAVMHMQAARNLIDLMRMQACGAADEASSLELCEETEQARVDRDLEELSQHVSVGAHHDTITGTAKPHVHLDEKASIQGASAKLLYQLGRHVVQAFELTEVPATATGRAAFLAAKGGLSGLSQFFIYNQHLQSRSCLLTLVLPGNASSSHFVVKFNGQPVKAVYLPLYEYENHEFKASRRQVQFSVEVPRIAPMSANLLSVAASTAPPEDRDGLAVRAVSRRITFMDSTTVLENSELRVTFDKRTFMPSKIFFKRSNQEISLKLSVVHYPTAFGQSGAYIFAPGREAVPLRLAITDAILVTGNEAYEKLIVGYKSQQLSGIQAILIMQLPKSEHRKRVLQLTLRSNSLPDDELFLRVEIKPTSASGEPGKFYVHDSLHHVRKGHVSKRVLSSRDIGAHFHPMVNGATYSYASGRGGKKEYLLSFFTGQRPNGVGYLKEGHLEFGIGRNVNFDDQKGLPDGTEDSSYHALEVSLGLFEKAEATSLEYRQYMQEPESVVVSEHQQWIDDTGSSSSRGLAFGKPLLFQE